MAFASSRPLSWTLETWPINVLLQAIRHDVDDDKVVKLVASLRAGKTLPAIFVLVEGPRVTILDGHHRVAAWAVAGFETAQVIVGRPG